MRGASKPGATPGRQWTMSLWFRPIADRFAQALRTHEQLIKAADTSGESPGFVNSLAVAENDARTVTRRLDSLSVDIGAFRQASDDGRAVMLQDAVRARSRADRTPR